MVIVDSHCHVSTCWYEPVESLLDQMDRNGVGHAVLVQMNGQPDNRYQLDVVRRFPGRFASVVWIRPDAPDACGELRRLAEQGVSGVRLAATARSSGDDALAIWRTAAELELSVSCGGATSDFLAEEFARLVQAVPTLRIVLEHLGGANHPGRERWEDRGRVFGLARFPNVYVKVHGLGEFCRRRVPVIEPFPFETPVPPLLELAYEAFGPRRMMWGSDYPPVSAREGYRNALRWTLERLAGKGQEATACIFGEVALAVFPVRP